MQVLRGGASSCGSATGRTWYARRRAAISLRECRGGNAAVHSEFSLGTHAKGQDEWDAAKRLYSQRYTVGTEGRGTLRFVCPESCWEEDRDRPRAETQAVPNHDAVAALCHEARDDAAPAQQQRPAASARTTHAAAGAQGHVALFMPAASGSAAATSTAARRAGLLEAGGDQHHRRDCCRRSVTAAFRPRRTTGRMNCARCVRSDSSGSRARAPPPSFRSASMKSSKTSSPLACAEASRRARAARSHAVRLLPPLPPSLPPSLCSSLAPSLPLHLRPRPASPLALALPAWPRAHFTLSPMSPHAQDVPERHQQPKADAGALRPRMSTPSSPWTSRRCTCTCWFSAHRWRASRCVLSYAPRP